MITLFCTLLYLSDGGTYDTPTCPLGYMHKYTPNGPNTIKQYANLLISRLRSWAINIELHTYKDIKHTVYGKTSTGKAIMVFHLTTNFSPQIMALSINNISLQNCYSKTFTVNSIFHSQHKNFPLQTVSCIWYMKVTKR